MKLLLVMFALIGCSCQHSPVKKITTLEPFDYKSNKAFVCVFDAKNKEMLCGNFEATIKALFPDDSEEYYINKF